MAKFSLSLLGPLVLARMDGSDATPRAMKTRALLAYLAIAEQRPVSRTKLQDLLWGDRMQQQGRQSLRAALWELRRCFEDHGTNPVHADRDSVVLRLDDIRVDLFDPTPVAANGLGRREFLEGIDVDGDEFNLWLVAMRANIEDYVPRSRHGEVVASDRPMQISGEPKIYSVCVVPDFSCPPSPRAQQALQLFASNVAGELGQSGIVNCFEASGPVQAGKGDQPRVDAELHFAIAELDQEIVVLCTGRHVLTRQIFFSFDVTISPRNLNFPFIKRCSCQIVDLFCAKLMRLAIERGESDVASHLVLSAIEDIFSLEPNRLHKAKALLHEAMTMEDKSSYYAWSAFLTAFITEKQGRLTDPGILEEAHGLSRKALELDTYNLLTRALVGHVYSFVMRDLPLAWGILEPVKDRANQNAMLSDTLAMANFYAGKYEQAYEYSGNAIDLGKFNVNRYGFLTGRSMSELMLGRFQDAISSSQAAIAAQPSIGSTVYEPALRTLAAACAASGRIAEGREALHLLQVQGSRFAVENLAQQEDAPFPNADVLQVVKTGMEKLSA